MNRAQSTIFRREGPPWRSVRPWSVGRDEFPCRGFVHDVLRPSALGGVGFGSTLSQQGVDGLERSAADREPGAVAGDLGLVPLLPAHGLERHGDGRRGARRQMPLLGGRRRRGRRRELPRPRYRVPRVWPPRRRPKRQSAPTPGSGGHRRQRAAGATGRFRAAHAPLTSNATPRARKASSTESEPWVAARSWRSSCSMRGAIRSAWSDAGSAPGW